VARPRLTGRLLASSGQKLTLISAPAGFGKTTLVSEWITLCKQPVAWVSLDAGDNDPVRFWSCVIAALQTLKPRLGENAQAMLQSPQPAPIRSVLTDLINEVAQSPQPLSLALDDYQAIREWSIQEAMLYFIEHMPAQMHIVLISRTDPTLPLARLRALNQLNEIRSDDLRFSVNEAEEFLNRVYGLDLSANDISALESRTEGWIAGLLLAVQSMQGRQDVSSFIHAFSGNHRYIVDYLMEEVFRQRPKGTRDFLLQTSILDRLCAPLCDALLERRDSQTTLEELEHANLFLVSLDDQSVWFRYHQLFADVLRARLQQTHPDLIPKLHQRAAQWFESNNQMSEAARHALATKDFIFAASIIEKIAPQTIVSGQIRTVLGWLESLPNDLMLGSPNLCLIHAAALMFTNQLEGAEARLQDADRYMQSLNGEETSQQRIIRGRLAVMRANLASIHGDIEECIDYARFSLTLLPESETYWRASPLVHSATAYLLDGDVSPAREEIAAAASIAAKASGNLFTNLRSITNLARLRATQGRLHQAEQTYHKFLDETSGGLQRLAGSAAYYFGFAYYFGLGSLYYEWNRLGDAEQHLLQGIELVHDTLTIDADMALLGYICLARLRQASGDGGGALAVLEDLAHHCKLLPGLAARQSAEVALIRLMQGDLLAALHWAKASGLNLADQRLPFPREAEYLVLARVTLARQLDNPDDRSIREVIDLLDRLLVAAETGNRLGSVIEILGLRALALHAMRDFEAARTSTVRALSLARPEGFLRVFVDLGVPMQAILLEISAQLGPGHDGIPVRDDISRVLAAFPGGRDAPDRLPAPVETPGKNLGSGDALTSRELEVLQLIAEGASNQDIGASLVIANPTVKRHISNIFDKLGVGSRTQALAQARKLGIIS
jgi:LuxR family maltose regulon positive regulatory protein